MFTALLLNADFTPIRTVPLQRTLSLLMGEKVDVIETVPGKMLRSPSTAIPMPAVMRLKIYRHVPRRGMTWSRRAVFARDNWHCVYCNCELNRETATVDHLTPRTTCEKMGIPASTWTNTAASCPRCNRKKAARSLEDSGMHFHDPNFIAKIPRTSYLIASGDFPESWKKYIRV